MKAICNKKVLIVLIVIGVILFSGFMRYHQKKEKLEREEERIIMNELKSWFRSKSLYCLDGKDGVYISEDQLSDKVLVYVRQWNEEGITTFINAENLVDKEGTRMSEELLRTTLEGEIDKDTRLDMEHKEAMKFIVSGQKGETKYKSVLEIEGRLFMESIYELDGIISGYFDVDPDFMLIEYWIDLFRKKEN